MAINVIERTSNFSGWYIVVHNSIDEIFMSCLCHLNLMKIFGFFTINFELARTFIVNVFLKVKIDFLNGIR